MGRMIEKFGNVFVRQSATAGLGVYAADPISAGTTIRNRTILREISPSMPLSDEERADHVCVVDDRFLLVGEPDCYLNHSCDPNAYLRYRGNDILLVARRDIPKEEQIALDYLINNSGGDSWHCECGAARCRGQTGASFFELPHAFQVEYLPLLADWFVEKHREELSQIIG